MMKELWALLPSCTCCSQRRGRITLAVPDLYTPLLAFLLGFPASPETHVTLQLLCHHKHKHTDSSRCGLHGRGWLSAPRVLGSSKATGQHAL